ncbi:MAG: hypothetical protein WC047_08960 [Kiritimatiellales bacterium]
MLKDILFMAAVLLLFSSCVSRSITTDAGFDTAGRAGKVTTTKTVWFWDKDFENP